MQRIKIVEWIGCIFGVIGAVIVASNLGINVLGYTFFLVGATSYMLVAFVHENRPLLLLNLVFAATNVLGLIRYQ